MLLLKNIESYLSENVKGSDEKDIMSDIRYICKSCSLMVDALQKGCDVMQMPDGDILVTEVKTVTFHYTWDDKKGKLVRVQSGGRLKKAKNRKRFAAENESDYDEYDIESDDEVVVKHRKREEV